MAMDDRFFNFHTRRIGADETRLLTNLGRGDTNAFWALWLRHRLHLYDVCLKQMNGIPSDAADAVSRSMLVAFAKLPLYALSIINLEAWLTRLTRNVCVDIRRERQRMAITVGGTDDLVVYESDRPRAENRPTPEDHAVAQETYGTICRAIDSLPPLLRDVAKMRFIHEASYETIASELEITPPNARKRVQQARALLRSAVDMN